MGVVYAATDPLIGRTVAIKTIRLTAVEAGQTREDLRQRLRREAQSAGVLSHPGIVTIYDIGEEDEEAYIVMEFVDGSTMEEVFSGTILQHRKTFLAILNKTAAALDYAHTKGVIHRDVKPSNIMICVDGSVKIADFGIAKISASTGLTQIGFVVGTPNYMSPEQAQGHPVDGRSDQFSLAVVAFRMLTGKLPFDGPTLTAVLTKILWEEPEYETTGLGAGVQAVFKKALSKDPAHRYPNCTDFVRDLEQASDYEKAELSGREQGKETRYTVSGFEPPATPVSVNQGLSGVLRAPNSSPTSLDLQSPASSEPKEEVAATGDLIVPSVTEPEAVPAAAARKPAKRAWIAAGGLLLMLVVVIAVVRILGTRESVPPASAPQAPSVAQTSGVAAHPAEPELAEQMVKPARMPSAATPAAKKKPEPDRLSVPGFRAGKAPPTKNAPANAMPISGVLTWAGSMGKNTVLVISTMGANFGVVTGRLPGVPVTIEVEPKGLVVRQAPAQFNGWSQIILYSGNQKYDSITIRWTVNK